MQIKALNSDIDLIAAVQQGQQQAFRLLVERYESQVAATVISMLGAGQEAEDVGQEVFIRFYRSLDQFQAKAALGTYLTRIAINLSLNALKKQQRKGNVMRLDNQETGGVRQIPDPGASQEARDTRDYVQYALQQLEPDFRSVVVLRMVKGYSTKETANMLNLPQGTVLSRLARGQKKLKEILIRLDPKLKKDE